MKHYRYVIIIEPIATICIIKTISIMYRCIFAAATIAILAITCASEPSSCILATGSRPIIHVYRSPFEDDEYCYSSRTASRSTRLCVREYFGQPSSIHDRPSIDIKCNTDYYISAIWATRDRLPEAQLERGYRCCRVSNLCTKNCYNDGPIHIDGDMDYKVKDGQVIVGVNNTDHHNGE